MINKVISVAIIISISVVFAGCGTPEAPDQVIGTPTGTTIQPTTGTGSPLDQTASVTVGEEVKVISETDQAAYRGALELNDLTYCNKIEDEELNGECKIAVPDKITLESAIANKDTTECEKLSTEDKKEACKINVETDVQIEKEREETIVEIQNDSDLMNEIIASGIVSRCSELEDPNFAEGCEVNIISNQAVAAQDISICSQASTENIKTICEDNVNLILDQ